jgi:hypothetical protein
MPITPFRQISDNALSQTATDLSSSGVTSILLATGTGSKFPQPGNGFWLTLWDNVTYPFNPAADPNMEKVVCTARTNDVLTLMPTTRDHPSPCAVALLDVAENTIDLQTAVNTLETTTEKTANKGAASGYASLDIGGKVPTSQLPASILGALEYQGTYDASGGSFPSNPSKGFYYVISVAGTLGGISYRVGDWLTYDGTGWDKIDNQQAIYTNATPTPVTLGGIPAGSTFSNESITDILTSLLYPSSSNNVYGSQYGTAVYAGGVSGSVYGSQYGSAIYA